MSSVELHWQSCQKQNSRFLQWKKYARLFWNGEVRYASRPHNNKFRTQIYGPQTKILEGQENIRERIFKALFTYVSTRFGLRSFEKCFENTFPNVWLAFQKSSFGDHKIMWCTLQIQSLAPNNRPIGRRQSEVYLRTGQHVWLESHVNVTQAWVTLSPFDASSRAW